MVGIIVQIMSYAITVLLVLRTMFDLTYITVPSLRTTLDGGVKGTPQVNRQQVMQAPRALPMMGINPMAMGANMGMNHMSMNGQMGGQ